MTKLMALAAKYKIDILGPLPEHAGVVGSEVKTDNEVIESVRRTLLRSTLETRRRGLACSLKVLFDASKCARERRQGKH